MKRFQIRTYEIHSPKMKGEKGVRFALLADLHGLEFGPENCRLEAAIRKKDPDAVLAAGDMIVRVDKKTLETAKRLLTALAKDYPVYYAIGNHEAKMKTAGDFTEDYLEYENSLREAGVVILKNEQTACRFGEDDFIIHGLELPVKYYHKPNSPRLSQETLKQLIGSPNQGAVNILLAHSPKYGKTYLSWGADLTVCGHYHGGVLRLSRHHGLTCPQFLLFPPYCCGDFHRENSHMIVSAGLGEHTIPIRIHNPRELIFIDMKKMRESGNEDSVWPYR